MTTPKTFERFPNYNQVNKINIRQDFIQMFKVKVHKFASNHLEMYYKLIKDS